MVRWIGCLLVLLSLGCAQESSRALKVATNQWLGYEPLYLARYIQAYQQNVDIVQLPSSKDVMRAIRNGNVEVAATTLDEALLLASQNEDVVVLMVLDFSNGADVVLGRPPISALKDIKGQKVCVENSGLGALMLSAALDYAGLSVADVELVTLPVDQHRQAYMNDEVDVIVTFEPVATQLRNAGANLLFDSTAVPDLIVDVLIARRDVVKQREQALLDLVTGYYRARAYMMEHPGEANSVIAKRMKMNEDDLYKAYSGLRLPTLQDNVRWLSGAPSGFEITRDRLQALMLERKLLHSDSSVQLSADSHWLEQVRQ